MSLTLDNIKGNEFKYKCWFLITSENPYLLYFTRYYSNFFL